MELFWVKFSIELIFFMELIPMRTSSNDLEFNPKLTHVRTEHSSEYANLQKDHQKLWKDSNRENLAIRTGLELIAKP